MPCGHLSCCWSGLVGLLIGERLLRTAEQARTDVRPVLGKCLRDLRLSDPVQVADRPVELLQRVLRGAAVLLLVAAAVAAGGTPVGAPAAAASTSGGLRRHGPPWVLAAV